MNLLKEVLSNEVYPAFGCTEPISCAFAAATAAAELGRPVEELLLRVDAGTYKNGAAVVVPCSGGAKGNLTAAALGAALARPQRKLELLQDATDEVRRRADELLRSGRAKIECIAGCADFRIEVLLCGGGHEASCVLAGGHTRVECVFLDDREIYRAADAANNTAALLPYRAELKKLPLAEVLALAADADDDDRAYLVRGAEMNLALAELGMELGGTATQLRRMNEDGFLAGDMFYRTKLRVASAVDARMAGLERAAMTSGGSGNQGIVAILTPYLVGEEMKVARRRIIESVAVAHLVNAYVKCYLGELSVICGCAMAAGIAAALAIVYQQRGMDERAMSLAAGNVIGDLGGLICDGAKPGCALKAITAVDAAMRSALMALHGAGPSADDGLVGRSVEDSLRNLGRITLEGMFRVDPTLLDILRDKSAASGKA
jgi:L-cysteine desulfidase